MLRFDRPIGYLTIINNWIDGLRDYLRNEVRKPKRPTVLAEFKWWERI
jgi:hypothetical protein